MIEHFTFLAEHTTATPKLCIPSPSVLHYRTGYNTMKETYPDIEEFFDDIGAAYNDALKSFYAAGCRYLQLDDTVWAYLCSEKERAGARERGDDPDRLPALYARTITQAIGDRPADMVLTTHVCRGNFRSTWLSEGGYEPIAEVMLSLPYDGFFLEYDDERSGDFEPLRFLPKGKVRAVLGLVTSKFPELEGADLLKRRIEEASKFADIDQLCLSPQCGFASTQEGNDLTDDEQWAKLRHVVEVARQVWADV
jgi:5-methyltetrahydropteroyltriglutamate--homocysteine methyltransferase